MNLPFDLEDLLGVAVADALKRFLALWSCATIGWVMVPIALILFELGEGVVAVITGSGSLGGVVPAIEPVAVLFGLLVGFFSPVLSWAGPLYLPYLIWMAVYFFRSEEWSLRSWKWIALGVSGGTVFAFFSWEQPALLEAAVFLAIWAGVAGAFLFFVRLQEARLRKKAEEHFIAIAAENEARRRELAEKFGTDIAGREFAVGAMNEQTRDD